MTFEESLNRFVKFLNEKGRSPSTVVAYKKDLSQLINHLQKNLNITAPSQMTTDVLKDFVEILKKDPNFTLKTVSRKINSFKTYCKFLLGEGEISTNIGKDVTHPSFESKPPRVLNEMEYKALRDTVRKNTRLYTMIELLLQTGIRIGEISRLQMKDVIMNSNPKYIVIEGYASNPERRVELNPTALQALGNYTLVRNSRRVGSEYLFFTKNDRMVLVRNIRSAMNKAFKNAGIENATVNDLRNTFIVYQLEAGMRPYRLAQIVGHQRISSTEKYLPLVKNKKKRGITKIQAL